jgi:hypothetical protein
MTEPMSSGLTRQQLLTAKFPALNWPPMDPACNTQVQAVLRAEHIMSKAWSDSDASVVLFDPARVPSLTARVEAATEDFCCRAGEGTVALQHLRHRLRPA